MELEYVPPCSCRSEVIRSDCELPEDLSHLISKTSQDAVAQGAFGDVWKCSLSYESIKVDVAVKVLRIFPYDENSIKDIRREMGIWRRMRNEHIVPMLGVANSFAPSRISIVSPWQKNGTLTSLLEDKHGTMNYKDRLLLLQDIASGLDYLHSVHVIHGDLTGSNVLIGANGRARLMDFGLSSFVNPDEGMTYLAVTTMRPGALRWAAPELVDDNTHILPTFGSDIYSFGSVVLQTLSGRLPWSEIRSVSRIIIKLSEGCHPERPESIHDAQWDFIMLCMNLVVESRPSAAEVVEWVKESISMWETSTGAANMALQPTSCLYSRLQLNRHLQLIFGSSVRDRVRWKETEFVDTAGTPAWRCVMHIDDMVHSVGEGATKGDAIDTAALHALVKFGLVQEQMLGWKFYLLNIALFGSLRSYNTVIEPVREENFAVAIRLGSFVVGLNSEYDTILVFPAVLSAVDVSLLSMNPAQSWQSTPNIMVHLSLCCVMSSSAISLFLSPRVSSHTGARNLFFLGLGDLALKRSLPFALLMWGTVLSAAALFF